MVLIFSLGLFTGISSAAKLEVFGGGQYSHLGPNFNLAGWNLAATVNAGHFSVSPIQIDWMATRFSGVNNRSSKNFRASADLVLRF